MRLVVKRHMLKESNTDCAELGERQTALQLVVLLELDISI
jgi:hypothetical protein